jgi:hypothetical protein
VATAEIATSQQDRWRSISATYHEGEQEGPDCRSLEAIECMKGLPGKDALIKSDGSTEPNHLIQ